MVLLVDTNLERKQKRSEKTFKEESRMNVKIKLTMATLATLMLGSGCTKSSSSSNSETPNTPTSTTLTISGSLQLSGSNASSSVGSMSANTKIGTSARKGKTNSFSASDYRVACATFEVVPKACGSTVDSAGAFALSCDGYKGVPFGCYVFNSVSYKNYPITFNIETSNDTTETSAPSVTSSLSSVSIVVDTDTGLATAAAVVEDPAAVTTIAVDTTAIGALDGTWIVAPKAYADVASKYSSEDFLGIKLLACFKNYWQTCGMSCSPEEAKTECANPSSMDSETAYDAMIQERLGGSGFPILLHSSTEGTKNYLSVWPDSASRAACGDIESGFTFKFSDGVDNTPQHKVDLDFTADNCNTGESPNDCLVRKVGTSIEKVVQNWFPMLYADVHGDTSAPSVTVNCKYMYNDLNGDIWNPNQEMINACQNNTGGISCMSGGDPMNATRNYVLSTIYSGVNKTGTDDAVLTAGHFSDLDFTDNVVAEGDAAYGYGYRTWNPDTHTEEWNVLDNPTRTDLGGCLQWPDWSKCSSGGCTSPQYPTIVPVGQDVTNYGPNADSSTDDNKWKCSFSEKRMLVQNDNGYIVIGGTKYFEAQPFITLNADTAPSDEKTKYQSWSKICDVADGSNHSYQTFPVDMDSTDIQAEASNRAGGGSPEQKKGMYMQAIYEQLTSDDHGGGGGGGMNFYTSGNRSITCNDIKNGAISGTPALTWSEVNSAFKYSFGPWQVGQLIKCVMLGISAHHGSGEIYEAAWVDLDTNFHGVGETFAESSTPGLPIVFANLKTNSCIPKFQMTHMCTTDGFCSPKVICDDYNAADGGCGDGADPASRMAKMNIDALPNNFFRFFDVKNRYDVMFNPSTNSNIVCQRAEYMSITSEDAITSSTTSVGMTFESNQAEINVTNPGADCQGNELGASSKLEMPDPKMYTTFTKQ